MVGPTRQEVEEPNDYSQVKRGFVVLIAVSGGLTALHGGGSLPVIVIATLAGGVVGFALMQYVFWTLSV